MARVKRGVTAHAKHKKVLKQAKGFFGRRKNTIRAAKAAVDKSMQYAYRDRKNRKREFRALWIQRINAAVREHGLTYSPLHRRPHRRRDRGRPQGAVGSRHHRAGGLRRDRREGQGASAEGGVTPPSWPGASRPSAPRSLRRGAVTRTGVPLYGVDARDKPGHDGLLEPTDVRPLRPSRTNPRRHRRRRRRAGARSRARRRARQEGLDLGAAGHPRQDVARRAAQRRRRDQRAEGRGDRSDRRPPRRAESRRARSAAEGARAST